MRKMAWILVIGMTATGSTPSRAADADAKADTTWMTSMAALGESNEIRERIRLYRAQHGNHGHLSSATMLDKARLGYRQWTAKSIHSSETPAWINLGPVNGAGRCTAVAPDPVVNGRLIAASAGGGLWRSDDSGLSWYPLTDGIADLSVGAVAHAPSDPLIIYLGSGEGGIAGDFIPGIGLLRSDDGGSSWFLPASPNEIVASQFFALAVDPEDGETLFAATNSGLLATADGGSTWSVAIPPTELVGVTEILRSPSNSDLLYAALWCAGECPEGLDRVMKSVDRGQTWVPAAIGLPEEVFNQPRWNRISLALAPSDDQILYAAAYSGDDDRPVIIYSSADGGDSWHPTTGDCGPFLGGQGWYDNTITVHPTNPEIVVAGGIWYVASHDGGANWTVLNPLEDGGQGFGTETIPHVDGHDLQWQGETLWLACDGGMWFSEDYGMTWTGRNQSLVTRQYYGMDVNPMAPEIILAGTQDNATNLRRAADDDTWDLVIHSDGFDCAINPLIPDFMYGTIYQTEIYRSRDGGTNWTDISPPVGGETAPFYTPMTIHESEPWVILTGTTHIWRSDDAGDSWERLSSSVASGIWSTSVVTAIATTRADPDVIWVAKDQDVYSSDDGGQLWWISPLGTRVNALAISPHDAAVGVACLARTVNGGNQIFATEDGGRSWLPSGNGLPPFAVQSAFWDRFDSETVYAGTDVGLYVSRDGGVNWTPMDGTGLPAASIHEIRQHPGTGRLVVATHGRGVWELNTPAPDNHAPTIAIHWPPDGSELVLGDPHPFTAEAVDVDGDELDVRWIFSDFWNMISAEHEPGQVEASIEYRFRRGGPVLVAAHADDGRGGTAVDTIEVLAYEPADNCESPRVIPGAGPFPVSIVTENWSTTESETDPDVPCVDETGDPTAGGWGSLWFELTPDESGAYAISTCGSVADTVLSTWLGPNCGPLTPVAGGCNDDDSFEHCTGERTDSYLELDLVEGETYRFMVGSWGEAFTGPVRFHVECFECQSAPTDHVFVVPAVAFEDGDNGTSWVTDLSLYNPGFTTVTARLSMQPAIAEWVEVSIEPGTAFVARNVVGSLLGSAGSGALRVEASGQLLIDSRTFNSTSVGTFGQRIAGVPLDEALEAGGAARLIGLRGDDAFRTNLGVASVGELPAEVQIELFDDNSQLLASFELDLDPYAWRQFNRIFEKQGVSPVDAAFAVVRNTGIEGSILTYASVVDEATGDPTFIDATDVANDGAALWVPVVAHDNGVGDSIWRSDLMLANIGTLRFDAMVEYLPTGESNYQPVGFSERVASDTMRHIEDLVGARFATVGSGALRISADRGQLVASTRTFNQSQSGTFGQFIPAFLESRAVHEDEVAMLQMLRSDQAYRSNVGIVNLEGQPIEVTATYLDSDGNLLGLRVYVVKPFSHFQANGAVPEDDVVGGICLLHSDDAGARFLAYASIVDNGTDDPIFIPARRVVNEDLR